MSQIVIIEYYLPPEKFIAAPHPKLDKPMKTGRIVVAKFAPKDFVKLLED